MTKKLSKTMKKLATDTLLLKPCAINEKNIIKVFLLFENRFSLTIFFFEEIVRILFFLHK